MNGNEQYLSLSVYLTMHVITEATSCDLTSNVTEVHGQFLELSFHEQNVAAMQHMRQGFTDGCADEALIC